MSVFITRKLNGSDEVKKFNSQDIMLKEVLKHYAECVKGGTVNDNIVEKIYDIVEHIVCVLVIS